jgi:tagatose 1,6-diphosphate aldolase
LPGRTGLLLAIEETGYTGSDLARISSLLPGWNVAKSKQMGADAVKFLVYYHPYAGELTAIQEDLIAEVIQSCREADLAFFLEPVSYSIDPDSTKHSAGFAAQLPHLMVEIAHRLGALGPDILKLEFPVNASYDMDEASWERACQAVSAACPCPWAVLSAGVDFEVFTRQVEIACRSGASGYIAGRSLWKEGIPLPPAERENFMRTVAAARLDRLSEIAGRYARPWRDFFPNLANTVKGWYQSYQGGMANEFDVLLLDQRSDPPPGLELRRRRKCWSNSLTHDRLFFSLLCCGAPAACGGIHRRCGDDIFGGI